MTKKSWICGMLVCCTLVVGCMGLVACGIGDTNTTYNRAQIGRQGKTELGRIIMMTQVDIAGTNKTGTAVGAGVGGLAGAIGGSAVGGGRGSALMALGGGVAGALVGGAVGGAAEQAATKDVAYEFVVRKESGKTVPIVQTNELGLKEGDNVVLLTLDGVTRIRGKVK